LPIVFIAYYIILIIAIEYSTSREKHFARDSDTDGRERHERVSSGLGNDLQNGVHTEYRISLSDNWMEPFTGRQYGHGKLRVQIHQQQHTLL